MPEAPGHQERGQGETGFQTIENKHNTEEACVRRRGIERASEERRKHNTKKACNENRGERPRAGQRRL